MEERLKIAVFIDFDNIQIGVKETLGKDFDVSIVLEALKERGEVVSKVAYADWPRSSDYSREMTQHAIHMVQRSVTPRGDKNGADINLALDALEMAFTRDHINTFVIVGGDSDFMALVEKLKQYDKRVFVVGGRQFTSGILQRNCHEFISYENLLKAGSDSARSARAPRAAARTPEARSLSTAMPNIQRALQILAEREVAPQLGLLKSTLLQLDPTFSERDFGAGSFLEFIQKLRKAGLMEMRRTDRGYLAEAVETEGPRETAGETAAEPALETAEPAAPEPVVAAETPTEAAAPGAAEPAAAAPAPQPAGAPATPEESLAALRLALPGYFEKSPNRPLYLRQIRQLLRSAGCTPDERSGFRGMLDLLHQAQREGWVRLHRDRKGVWRVFPAGTTPPASAAAPPQEAAGPEPAADLSQESEPELFAPVETDVDWEFAGPPEDLTEPGEVEQGEAAAPPEEVSQPNGVPEGPAPDAAPLSERAVVVSTFEEVVEQPAESPAEEAPPKTRKARTPKAASKPAKRKAAPKRKKASEKPSEEAG